MTSPVVMPAGHAILAADLDAYENLTGPWTPYTPVWSSTGTQPSLGNGTSDGRYMRSGDLIISRARFDFGSTTTFGTGVWNFSLPVPFSGISGVAATYLSDQTGVHYPAVGALFSGKVFLVAVGGDVTATNPFVWATTDNLLWTIIYEGA